MPTDEDYLNAIFRYFYDDTTFYNMVDGQIFVNLPESQVLSHLGSTYQTVVGIAIPSSSSRGRLGSFTSKLKEVEARIVIDVLSTYGASASYCNQVLDKIEDMTYYDIEYTLGATDYHIFVTRIERTMFQDENLGGAWHGVCSIVGNYVRQTT